MNRFLKSATAMTLGLALGGIAKADGTGQRSDHEGFERDRTADCGHLYWDGLRYFDHGWFGPDDLRHFDDWRNC